VSHDSIRGYVRPSIGPSVGRSVMLFSAGRDEPANDLFCVYELVLTLTTKFVKTRNRERKNLIQLVSPKITD